MVRYKHQELQAYLRACIHEHAKTGKPLESENVLSKKFGLSRTTIRRAQDELVHQGLCRRIRGKGTFACDIQLSHKIALIIYDTAYMLDPVTGNLIRGIDSVLSEAGYCLDILTGTRDRIDENLSSYPANYAGLLIGAAQLSPEILRSLFQLHLPCLTVKNYFPGLEEFAVRIDFERAGELAADHLIEQGCRELGTVIAYEKAMITQEFLRGIQRRCLENGVRLREANMLSFTGLSWEKRQELLERALVLPERPQGFVCFADFYADALYRACLNKNLSVPDDVMIVGCNHQDFSDRYKPEIGLTSLEIPTQELGCYAARLLFERLAGKSSTITKLQPRLFVAESTQKRK